MRNPNSVLKGPATLMYGGGWWQIVITAPGVKILNLNLLYPFDVGIHLRVNEPGEPIFIKGNTIKTVIGIDASDLVRCGAIIKHNKLEVQQYVGIVIPGTYWVGEEPTMAPVIIEKNQMHCDAEHNPELEAILLGIDEASVNYAKVQKNTITGHAAAGIIIGPFSNNNMVKGNDLSGLTTWAFQLKTMGENNKFMKNIIGPSNGPLPEWVEPEPFFGGYNLAAYIDNEGFGGDPAWTRYNKFMHNDYRNSGLDKGWIVDEVTDEIYSRGCVFLYPGPPPGEEGAGLGLEDNLIAERLFPEGTNVCNQVWDYNGKNIIKGWSKLCENGGGSLAKPIVHEKLPAAERIFEYKNAQREKNTHKYEYLDRYLSKNVKTEMAVESVLPQKFDLKQNYPNPFNPTTKINYQLPITNFVDLSIYNTLGQKIVTLVSEQQEAGSYEVQWDASGFSSGVYYYRIEAAEFQDIKKMILLK